MINRWDRGEFSGDYARDTHRGYGDDYARDGGWSGGGRADDYVREPRQPSYRGPITTASTQRTST
jgi:hypothetical protein